MVFDELAHGYERCAVCGIPLSEMTASICTACRRKLQQREVDQLQAEIAQLTRERDEAREVAGYCLKMAFSSWPGLWNTLTRYTWLKPVDRLDDKRVESSQ